MVGEVRPKRDYSDTLELLPVTFTFPDAATIVVGGTTVIVSASVLL